MKTTIWATAGILWAAGLALGQSPAFEVASIKPSNAEEGHSHWRSGEGKLNMSNVSLRAIIAAAYEIKDYQLVGPEWLEKERFDIVAKTPAGANDEQFPAMMRALLAERFHLATHRDKKSMAAYALVVAKGGLKIHPVEPGHSSNQSKSGADRVVHWTARRVSMANVAEHLFRTMDRPVVDKTGVPGVFDFKLDWALETRPRFPSASDEERRAPAENPNAPTIFTAIQELGLRLQPEKTEVEILVVDACEKAPTEN